MRNLENIDLEFSLYVLKKYVYILLIAALFAALGVCFFTKIGSAEKIWNYVYVVFSVWNDDNVLPVNEKAFVRKVNREFKAAYIDMSLPAFRTGYRKAFAEKNGMQIPDDVVVGLQRLNSYIIFKIQYEGQNQKIAEALAAVIQEKAAQCLSSLEFKSEITKENDWSKQILKKKGKRSYKTKTYQFLYAFMIVLTVMCVCFCIEILRNRIISGEDLKMITGKEVFRYLDNPLASTAAGRSIIMGLENRKFLTLLGNCNGKTVSQTADALKRNNLTVCTILVAGDSCCGTAAPLHIADFVSKENIVLHPLQAAEDVRAFHNLLEELAKKYDVVVVGINAVWRVLPAPQSCMLTCTHCRKLSAQV